MKFVVDNIAARVAPGGLNLVNTTSLAEVRLLPRGDPNGNSTSGALLIFSSRALLLFYVSPQQSDPSRAQNVALFLLSSPPRRRRLPASSLTGVF